MINMVVSHLLRTQDRSAEYDAIAAHIATTHAKNRATTCKVINAEK
jgi:hypothetical protein